MEMDALYEKFDSREGEKFVFSLAKARHRATQDIGVVKSVRNSEGATLRKPEEVRRRGKEYFDRLLNEEFARENSSHLEATAGPIKLWTEGWKGNWSGRSTYRGMEGARRARDKVAHPIPEHCHR
uniref:Transposase n=1 Tax=Haemonchus contortus TaxID=6289 RepID=A0A7I4XVU9_HAECO